MFLLFLRAKIGSDRAFAAASLDFSKGGALVKRAEIQYDVFGQKENRLLKVQSFLIAHTREIPPSTKIVGISFSLTNVKTIGFIFLITFFLLQSLVFLVTIPGLARLIHE
ncbi:MAG: hypothetical protein NT121_00465 [Chloroflexi bacterium]|nr:hypothetical protein [Chloroflexota bacterium]